MDSFLLPLVQWRNSTKKQCGFLAWNGSLAITPECYTLWTSYVCERSKNISLTCDVDNQWLYSSGTCFRIFSPERAWDDARRYCIEQDADLAQLTDRESLAMIWDEARTNNSTKYWIGLRADGKQFLWTDNTAPNGSQFWDKDEPKYSGSKRTPICVAVDGSLNRRLASWVTFPCSEHISFTCSKKPGVCPDGWLQHQTSCLHWDLTISLSWMQAKAYCRYIGGDLIKTKSASDQDFLKTFTQRMKDAQVNSFWIGLSDERGSDGWIWSDGDKLDPNATNWAKAPSQGKPDQRDCVYVNTASAQWRTTPVCSKARAFVCEVEAGTIPKPFPDLPASDRCPPDWEAAGASCLKVYRSASTWYQAVSRCQADNAQLLIITSSYVQAYLEGNMIIGETFWLGLSDRETEGKFLWVNGIQMTSPRWFKGEPSTDPDKNCVTVQSDGKSVSWKMESCQATFNYICYRIADNLRKRRMSPATTTPAPYDAACGKGWERRMGTNLCYQFRDTKLSWVDAMDVCQHHNGSLASVTSRDEQSYIEGRLKGLSSVAVWLGANDRETEAGWAWEDGAPFGFLNWFPGEPNNMGNQEDCAAINTVSMAWYDYPCETRAGFVCKKLAEGMTTTLAPTTTISIPDGKFYGCPPGWLAYQDNCYLLRKTQVSWLDAQSTCRKEGAELASVSSLQENQIIFSYLPKVSCGNAHANDTTCKAWAELGECQKNPQWMSLNCQAACTFCSQTCSDKHTQNECRFWASIGECTKNKWMPENCALSCGCDSSINFGFWIGLNDRQSQMSFSWSDLSPLTFTNWAKNEPNNYSDKKEDCVRMFAVSGEWGDEVCEDNTSGYVCKKKKSLLDHPTVSPDRVGCPIGAFGYGPLCYMLVDIPMTWLDAKRYCNNRKANLATITDRTVGAFITSELIGKTSSYWLGLRAVGRTYNWSSGANVVYTPWAPSHTGNENNMCVAVRSQRPVGLWEDKDCQQQQPFICEVSRVGYTTPAPTTASSSTASTSPAPCADGWKGFQDFCYKLHTDIQTWSESQATCQVYGGSLASIHDAATMDFISSQLTYLYSPETVWIGLSDSLKEASYQWSDGSPFDFSSWATNEPNNAYGSEDCVQLYRYRKKWNDNSCFTSAAFVCAVPRGFPIPTVPPTTIPPPALPCADPGWAYRHGFCYYVSPQYGTKAKLSWFEANRMCMAQGGQLASIASQAENDFLLSLISKHSDSDFQKFWIGFNELGQKSYRWSDGSPPIFLAWAFNEPNDAWGGQKCVNMYTGSGRWNDDNCMDGNGYVCKKRNGSSIPVFPVPTAISKMACPPGFQGSGLTNSCYFLGGLGNQSGDLPLNWTAARDRCRQLQAIRPVDIASIPNRLDQDFITLLIFGHKRAVWIGLSDHQSHRTFKWQDNSEVTFTNWGTGEPNDHWSQAGERDCVEVVSDPTFDPLAVGTWKVEVCQQKNAYLCQTAKAQTSSASFPTSATSSTPAPSTKGPCAFPSFIDYNGTCFSVVSQAKTWPEARKACQFFGGDLASILDVYEAARLDLEVYNHHIAQPLWIGLTFDMASSSYQWSDSWPLQMTFWSRDDPDQQTNNSCVALHKGLWNDTDCSLHLPFICAIRKGQPPSPTPQPIGHCPGPAPDQQVMWGDYCYQAFPTPSMAWPTAVYSCGQMGMQLASVHSQAETAFLYHLLKAASQKGGSVSWGYRAPTKVWLGMDRNLREGFRWSDKSEVNYFNWDDGQPSSGVSVSANNLTTFDSPCVLMDIGTAKWSTADCLTVTAGHVCKVLKVMPSTTTVYPASTRSTSQKPLQPNISDGPYKPQTDKQTHTGHSTLKELKSGLTGGQVAGIVLGVICFFVIVAIVIFVVRQRFHFSKLKAWGRNNGFDNALYSHHSAGKAVEVGEDNGLDQMVVGTRVTLGGTSDA